MGIVPISLKLRDARERRALVMAKGLEVVWRWKGVGHLGLSMVVLGTHDTLGLGPPLSPPCVGQGLSAFSSDCHRLTVLRVRLPSTSSAPSRLWPLQPRQACSGSRRNWTGKRPSWNGRSGSFRTQWPTYTVGEAVLPGLGFAEPECSRAASELA